MPADEVTADLHKPALRLDDAGNEVPDKSVSLDDLSETDMDRLLRVTFGKEHQYAPSLTELIPG